MIKINYLLILGLTLLFSVCKSTGNKEEETGDNTDLSKNALEIRYQKLLEYPVNPIGFPRSMTLKPEEIHKVPSKDWTSGFFPGNLWQIYKLTGDEKYKQKATEWTAHMEDQKYNDRTHDMGFKVYCSFGEGFELTSNSHYKDVILESSKTLCTRFNSNVGSIRSWDFNADIWEYPVIIDNMMNLELLFEATRLSGDSSYHKLAVKHANTTLKNHFRPDNSTWHVLVYDTITGQVKQKVTHQGYNDNSSWARGQAWAIYGFTMSYRYTNNPEYLNQAEATAKFFINHENMPEDGIPYWDFNAPGIPDEPRDVSAAAVVASALFEMFEYTKDSSHLEYATKVVDVLNSEAYLLSKEVNGPFILDHSTGNWPKNDEIDEPIVYADYYFLEALLRKKNIE